jgi:hypothetical protein
MHQFLVLPLFGQASAEQRINTYAFLGPIRMPSGKKDNKISQVIYV